MSSGWVICLCNSLKKIGTAKNAAFQKFIMKKMQIFKASFKLWIMQRNVIYATSIFPLFPIYLLLSTLGQITGGFTCALDESECMAHLQMGSLTGVGRVPAFSAPPPPSGALHISGVSSGGCCCTAWMRKPRAWTGASWRASTAWRLEGCRGSYFVCSAYLSAIWVFRSVHLPNGIAHLRIFTLSMPLEKLDQLPNNAGSNNAGGCMAFTSVIVELKAIPPPKFHNPQTIYPH